MKSQHHRDFTRSIQQLSQRHHSWRVFSDFCEMATLALASSVSFGTEKAHLEERYLQLVQAYNQEEALQLAQLLGVVTAALEEEPGDFLGEMFMSLELYNHWKGQYFTPMALTEMMSMLLIDGQLLQAIEERGFVTVQEPASGSGAAIIGLALALQAQQLNFQQVMHATAIDVDATAAHMAYIQLSLLGIPAIVIVGNTLSMELRDHFYTPMHVLDFWNNKLRRGYALGSAADQAQQPKPPPLDLSRLRQVDLFAFPQPEEGVA